ncbi:MAG: WYL domain-containing protein [Coriobacteriales bacterium]|jgi:predicted DNA-binding transcriptional regulator YafY|nr:WYL domain-containing protein [Coriobacteriales bacterium]
MHTLYTVPPKKMLALNILNILRKYTDRDHRLSQKEIVELLERDYQMVVDRKAVRRNLDNLIDAGYDIEFSFKERRLKNAAATSDSPHSSSNNPAATSRPAQPGDPQPGDPQTETVTTGWYINREFEDSELRLLIDSLLFSHQIPSAQCRQLIDKLKGLSNQYFNARVKHVHSLPEIKSTNRQIFYTIQVLDEAIDRGMQVSFEYGASDTKGQLNPRLDDEGRPRAYRIDPYQLVATNGRYYLICRFDPYDELAYYRVDRILNIELLETPVKPLRELPGLEAGLDLPRHMAEHVYMFSGAAVRTRFRINRSALMHVFDWFGGDVCFENETDKSVEVILRVNEQAMCYWALQFYEHVEVLEPQSLRKSLQEAGCSIVEKYGN